MCHSHPFAFRTTSVPETLDSYRTSQPQQTGSECAPSAPMMNQMKACVLLSLFPELNKKLKQKIIGVD